MPSAFTGVVVSEFLPNPRGDEAWDEWIELWNPTDAAKPLCGWSIDDGERGSEPYRLDRLQLHPGDRAVLPRHETGISLNNDADAVRLVAPLPLGGSGAVEIVRYAQAPEDRSYARREDGTWLWAGPTPGEANAFEEPRWPEEVLAEIVQVLPDPSGRDDAGGEWIEIANRTAFPLPLTGWTLETASDAVTLPSTVLSPRERRRMYAVITLPNAGGFVRLRDAGGVPVSVLAWEHSDEGHSVSVPEPLSVVPDLTFASTEDCREWTLRDTDEHVIASRGSWLLFDDSSKCNKSISDLMENKKLEYKIYSSGTIMTVGGTDVSSLLLRHGIARLDPAYRSPFHATYLLHEREAREARRGVWADGERTALIDEAAAIAEARETIQRDGFRAMFSSKPGIVPAGTAIAITTNVPADVSVAFGTGALAPYTGPIVVDRDLDVRIEAVAHVSSATGSPILYKSIQPFLLLKNRYPMVRVSEIYPSPKAGEREWVELWNPTDEPVPLLGWSIDDAADAGSAPAELPADAALAPGERRIFEGLSVAWNNDGDAVRLLAPNGRASHETAYDSVKKGMAVAFAFGNGGRPMGACVTAHPTPGTENRCAEAPPKIAKKKAPTKKATAKSRRVRYRNLVADTATTVVIRPIFAALREAGGSGVASSNIAYFWLAVGLIAIFIVLHRVKAVR